jgi:hypothetical protein
MACRYFFIGFAVILALVSCKAERPVEQKKPEPVVLVKPKPPVLREEQRKELGFPSRLVKQVELAADAKAEPFFVAVVLKTENLKGEKGFESRKLAGFSVRTKKADDLIESLRAKLRAQGYLVFKSQKSYGTLPEIATIVKGNNSYDILKIQGTEAVNYHLDTKAIIVWLRARQKEGTFMITGAGPDWLEAMFIKQPKNMTAFAKKVAAFAPDVLARGTRTVDKLAERMKKTNGFTLAWD